MESFPLLAVMTLVLIPLLQSWLARLNFRGNHIAIAMLMFCPGLCVWLFLWRMVWGPFDSVGSMMYFAIGDRMYFSLVAPAIVTILFFVIWWFLKRGLRAGRESGEVAPVPSIWKPCVGILGLILVISFYLSNYKTLEDAVKLNDVDLARRRLNFNLLGVGPNDGGLWLLSSGLVHYPLLPIAVHHGNKEMVDLLLEHGADLSPEGWDWASADADTMEIGYDNGNIQHNTLYYAIFNNNQSMLKYLLDKGADPTQGVSLAVYREDTELLADLLRRGGDPNEGLDSASGDPVMLEYLLHMGADRAKALRLVVGYGRIGTLAYLLTIGVEMDEIRSACVDCNLPLDELDAWVQRGCELSDPWLLGRQG